MLVAGSRYDGGLSNFYINTVQDYSLLAGLGAGFIMSSLISIGISLCTNKIRTSEDVAREWSKTTSIDNPLNPYRGIYREELDAAGVGPVVTAEAMANIFKGAKKVALIGGSLSIILFIVVIPAVALSYETVNQEEFSAWVSVCQIWCLICTVFVVLFPPVEEGIQIWRQYKKNRENHGSNEVSSDGFYNKLITKQSGQMETHM